MFKLSKRIKGGISSSIGVYLGNSNDDRRPLFLIDSEEYSSLFFLRDMQHYRALTVSSLEKNFFGDRRQSGTVLEYFVIDNKLYAVGLGCIYEVSNPMPYKLELYGREQENFYVDNRRGLSSVARSIFRMKTDGAFYSSPTTNLIPIIVTTGSQEVLMRTIQYFERIADYNRRFSNYSVQSSMCPEDDLQMFISPTLLQGTVKDNPWKGIRKFYNKTLLPKLQESRVRRFESDFVMPKVNIPSFCRLEGCEEINTEKAALLSYQQRVCN